MQNTLADLDELILACRSVPAKTYIAEAVSCYRGGAYRSAIVATWIAVMFDFLDKLRELEMAGDANAKQKVADFEKWRQANDWKSSLNFENEMITVARREFELLSPVETIDLERLREDRNRCAHPSMASAEEPYNPSAELARTHIRNAVTHLLSHPPVQGQAALERVMNEVESEYFPADASKAMKFFKTGPLGKAREALVRNFFVAMSKKLLKKKAGSPARARRFAALNAVLGMYAAQVEHTMASQLPALVATVGDGEWYRVLFFLANVKPSWELIGDAIQAKARGYVEKAPEEVLFRFLPYAMKVPALRSLAVKRLPEATGQTLAKLAASDPSPEVVEEVFTRFENASSYRRAEEIFETLVLPLSGNLQSSDIERVCKAFVTNRQINQAIRMPDLLLQLIDEQIFLLPSTRAAWKALYNKLDGSLHENKALRERLRSEFDL